MTMRARDLRGTRTARTCRAVAVMANLVAAMGVSPAHGADEKRDAKEACIAASERGQSQRDEGKYREARDAFLECAQVNCPRVVAQSCTKWLRELDETIPTLVLGARDERGNDLTAVVVTLDGAPFATELDGKPIFVDIGPHVLRFQREGAEAVEQRLVVRAGEKARVVTVSLPSTEAIPVVPAPDRTDNAPRESAPILLPRLATASIVGLGSLAAAATGLAFVLKSNSESSTANSLRVELGSQDSCTAHPSSPACVSLGSAVDAQRTDMNVAAGLFVGAGLLAASALVVWFAWPKPKAAAPQVTGLIAPTPGGAAFLFLGHF